MALTHKKAVSKQVGNGFASGVAARIK